MYEPCRSWRTTYAATFFHMYVENFTSRSCSETGCQQKCSPLALYRRVGPSHRDNERPNFAATHPFAALLPVSVLQSMLCTHHGQQVGRSDLRLSPLLWPPMTFQTQVSECRVETSRCSNYDAGRGYPSSAGLSQLLQILTRPFCLQRVM